MSTKRIWVRSLKLLIFFIIPILFLLCANFSPESRDWIFAVNWEKNIQKIWNVIEVVEALAFTSGESLVIVEVVRVVVDNVQFAANPEWSVMRILAKANGNLSGTTKANMSL